MSFKALCQVVNVHAVNDCTMLANKNRDNSIENLTVHIIATINVVTNKLAKDSQN